MEMCVYWLDTVSIYIMFHDVLYILYQYMIQYVYKERLFDDT